MGSNNDLAFDFQSFDKVRRYMRSTRSEEIPETPELRFRLMVGLKSGENIESIYKRFHLAVEELHKIYRREKYVVRSARIFDGSSQVYSHEPPVLEVITEAK